MGKGIRDDITRRKHRGNRFSDAAHEAAVMAKETQYGLILDLARRHGTFTCEDAEKALGIPKHVMSGRLAELRIKYGKLELAPVDRWNESGRKVQAYRIPGGSAPEIETTGQIKMFAGEAR